MSVVFLMFGIGLGCLMTLLALLAGAGPLGLAAAYIGGGMAGIMLSATLVFQSRHALSR